MSINSWSRAVIFVPALIVALPVEVAAADSVQLLPTETPIERPLFTSDAEHNKLILTAGTSSSEASPNARPQIQVVDKGTSSRRTKRTAVEDLALHRLPIQNRRYAESIVDGVSVFRRLPAYRCEVDPRVHDYFTHHPDVAVSMWRAMGVSQLQMWKTSDWSYGMDTKDGTSGTIQVLYRSRESCLIVCQGMFKSPYLQKAIAAKSLIHLRTRFSKDQSGGTLATHQADMFVAFPSQKVETVAKLVSPVSNVIIDRNFQEISLFIHVMGLAMGRQPGWVEKLAGDLDGIEEDDRSKLVKLTAEVYVDTQTALRRQRGEPVTLEAIRPPVVGSQKRSASGVQPAAAEKSVLPR